MEKENYIKIDMPLFKIEASGDTVEVLKTPMSMVIVIPAIILAIGIALAYCVPNSGNGLVLAMD